MRKISLGLFICGLLLILSAFIYLTGTKSKEKTTGTISVDNNTTESLSWQVVIGNDIKSDYPLFDRNDYIIESINCSNDGKKNISFAIPSDVELHMIGSSDIKYEGLLTIDYLKDINIENIDSFLSKYIDQYRNEYMKITVSKLQISDNTFAYYAKFLNEESKKYMEELILLYGNNNSHSYIRYQILNNVLSNNFINRILSEFKVNDGKTPFTNCLEQNNQYKCEIQINSIKKKITYTVDSTKYQLNDKEIINDYSQQFVFGDNNNLKISLILYNNFSEYSKQKNFFSFAKLSNVIINNKKIDKYSFEDSKTYYANYIVTMNNKIYIMLTISNNNNKLDDIAQDFVDFELTDM